MGFLFLVEMAYTKYLAKLNWLSIAPVQIESETAKFVTLENGHRTIKRSDIEVYCDTHEDAVRTIYDHLLKKAEAAKDTFLHHEERLNEFAKKLPDWKDAPEPATDNEPVTPEWLILMGFQFYKKSETFIIPAMRGGYNYDVEVNAQFIALRDIERNIVTVLHDTMYHGTITQEKVLRTLMLFN